MRILEFIKQNCENVEFHALGDVCNKNSFKQIGAGELENLKVNNPKEPIKLLPSSANYDWISDREICKDFICKGEVITLGRARYANLKYHNGEFISSNNILISAKTGILGKFLYYFIENNKEKFYVATGTYPKFDMKTFDNFKIPVPSLEVQNKIVEVLDSFSSLVRSLVRSLVLEKTAREKQYKYYLNHLITNARNSRIFKLGEVCEIKGRIGFRGYTTADMVKENQGAITLSPRNIINQKIDFSDLQFISWAKYEESPEIMIFENDVVFCKTGSTLGKVAIIENLPQKTTLNPQLVVFKNIKCNNRFLYYVVSTENFQSKAQSLKGVGAVPNISQGNLANIEFPLPPLDEQERIIRILDSLNELANGLSAGIPKEIELRQKQYEYWRDRLLEFPSKDSK